MELLKYFFTNKAYLPEKLTNKWNLPQKEVHGVRRET